MEANLHHTVFDFISVTYLIRHGAISEFPYGALNCAARKYRFTLVQIWKELNVLKRHLKYRSHRRRTQMLKIRSHGLLFFLDWQRF
jgi:hypothetical protein